ncbi:MAG: FAD-dependent oxidoreductase, partial [Candidatus Thermoplasmatota archaeon]
MESNTGASELPHIVVVGGGFGGLESAFYLRMRLGKHARITLVSDRDEFLFKPNTIYIPFGKDPQELTLSLADATSKRDIRFVKARVEDVDPVTKTLATTTGPLQYDHLILATGASMRPDEIPGLKENANTIWTPSEMMRLRESLQRIVGEASQGRRQRVLF